LVSFPARKKQANSIRGQTKGGRRIPSKSTLSNHSQGEEVNQSINQSTVFTFCSREKEIIIIRQRARAEKKNR
jgi:hypothetical protein